MKRIINFDVIVGFNESGGEPVQPTPSEKEANQAITFPMTISDAKIKEIVWKLDREIWAKVEAHEATQSWGREQSAILIIEYFGSIEEKIKESALRQNIIDGQRKTLSQQWEELTLLREQLKEKEERLSKIVASCGSIEDYVIKDIKKIALEKYQTLKQKI